MPQKDGIHPAFREPKAASPKMQFPATGALSKELEDERVTYSTKAETGLHRKDYQRYRAVDAYNKEMEKSGYGGSKSYSAPPDVVHKAGVKYLGGQKLDIDAKRMSEMQQAERYRLSKLKK